jgi:hypothetical protein
VHKEVEKTKVINEGTEKIKTVTENLAPQRDVLIKQVEERHIAGAPVIAPVGVHVVEEKEHEHKSLGAKIKDALGLGGHREHHEEHVRYGPNGEKIVEKIDTEYRKK